MLDGRAWDRLEDIFTVDAVFDASTLRVDRYESRDEIAAGFAAIGHPVSHHSTNVVVIVNGRIDASAVSKFLVPLRGGKVISGEYRDRLLRTDDGWRITERLVVPSRPQENTL